MPKVSQLWRIKKISTGEFMGTDRRGDVAFGDRDRYYKTKAGAMTAFRKVFKWKLQDERRHKEVVDDHVLCEVDLIEISETSIRELIPETT